MNTYSRAISTWI